MLYLKLLVSNSYLRTIVLLSLVYISLELYYNFVITVGYSMGHIADLNLIKYAITKAFFILFMAVSYSLFKRSFFLYAIFLLLIFFFYIPNAIFFSFSNGALGPFFSNVFFVSVFLATPYVRFSIPSFNISSKKKNTLILGLAISLIIPIIATYRMSFNLNTLLLSEIYTTREIFSQKMLGYLNYFYHFEVKTIIPIAMVFFLIRKKLLIVGLLVLAELYLYVISGNKAVYFSTFIIIFFYYLGSSYQAKISIFFISMVLFLIFAPIIDSLVFGYPLLGGTFILRFLFIPSLLTQWYFEFFEGNPFYFAESHIFNLFVESPYEMPVGFLLTKIYWNDATVYANNGIVSDGFMNLGYFGVFLFSIIFSLLFSLFNSFKLNIGYFGVFFSYIYVLLSAPLLTSFITGGLLIFIVLCFFVLSDNIRKH